MKKIRYLLLIIVIMICIFFYQDPYAMEESKILMAPTFENILGCDNLGRDIFSRLLLGSFYTLAIAFLSISLSVITGTIIGSLAGYFGKGIDVIIMSIVEVIMSIPGILIALGIIIILGTGFHSLIVAIFVIYIPRCVNVVRGLVKKEKNMEYVIAVKTYGVSDLRIIYRHIYNWVCRSYINRSRVRIFRTWNSASLSHLGKYVKSISIIFFICSLVYYSSRISNNFYYISD